jgi:hypothetical protein
VDQRYPTKLNEHYHVRSTGIIDLTILTTYRALSTPTYGHDEPEITGANLEQDADLRLCLVHLTTLVTF